jgi:hypothetical protein
MYLDDEINAESLPPVQVGPRTAAILPTDTHEGFWLSVTQVAVTEDGWLDTFAAGPDPLPTLDDVLGD